MLYPKSRRGAFRGGPCSLGAAVCALNVSSGAGGILFRPEMEARCRWVALRRLALPEVSASCTALEGRVFWGLGRRVFRA